MSDFNELDHYLIDNVSKRIALLREINVDRKYLAAELCDEFWGSFNESDHIIIGKRLKKLAEKRKIAIEQNGRTSCNKCLYRITYH